MAERLKHKLLEPKSDLVRIFSSCFMSLLAYSVEVQIST